MTVVASAGDHRFGALSAVYGGDRAQPAIMLIAPGVSAAILCVATPWPLTPPAWLAALAALLCGLSVTGCVWVLRALVRTARTVLDGRALPMMLVVLLGMVVLVPVSDAAASASDAGSAARASASVATQPSAAPTPTARASASVAGNARGYAVAGAEPLGVEGRRFLELPVTTPVAPVRAYVGRAAAADDAGRAALAVETLRRTGGFARGTVLVVVPTGSGWVDPAALTAFERREHGDLATVVVQYAERPSWVEFLLGGDAAARSAAATVSAIRAALPPGGPRLLLFGESLGAAAALPVTGLADECVLAGRPGSATDPQHACTELANPDDPVVAWSPGLALTDPIRLWQVTAALLIAQDVGPGHGHRYEFSS